MKCTYCGFENPIKARFCGKCGKALVKKKTGYKKILLFALVLIGVAGIILLAIPKNRDDHNGIPTPTPTTPTPTAPTPTTPTPTAPIPTTPTPTTPTLSISVTGSPDPVVAGGTSQVTVHVTSAGGTPVSGASVSLSAADGSLNPTTGTTDMNGDFKSTYTAPGTDGTYKISATASKTDYTSGSGSDQIAVNPLPQLLSISVAESPDPVNAGGTSRVMVHVTAGGTSASGASVSVSVTGGNLNPTTGTADTNGDFKSTYTAPDTEGTYKILVTASKTGYTDGAGSDQITVSPAGFRIVEVMLRADPFDYSGPCPVTITFSGRISVAGGAGTVSYKFIRSDGASAPIQTLQFTEAGSKDVSDTWYLGGSGSGWEAIKTFDPQGVESSHADFKIQCSQGLVAPAQLSPANGSVFSNYPRTTSPKWSAVTGATSYTVEIDCYHCCQNNQWCTDVGQTWDIVPNVATTSYTFDFVGAQPGRWRVWAVDSNGQAGPKSGWWYFSYTR